MPRKNLVDFRLDFKDRNYLKTDNKQVDLNFSRVKGLSQPLPTITITGKDCINHVTWSVCTKTEVYTSGNYCIKSLMAASVATEIKMSGTKLID